MLSTGKEAKRKLAKGTYSVNVGHVKLNSVQYSTCIINFRLCVSNRSNNTVLT